MKTKEPLLILAETYLRYPPRSTIRLSGTKGVLMEITDPPKYATAFPPFWGGEGNETKVLSYSTGLGRFFSVVIYIQQKA